MRVESQDFEAALNALSARRMLSPGDVAGRLGITRRTLKRRLGALDGEKSLVSFLNDVSDSLGITLAHLVKEAETCAILREQQPKEGENDAIT